MGYVAKLKEDFDDRGFSGASLAKNQAVWVSKEGSGGHGVVMVAPYVGPFHEQEIGVPESLLVKVAMNDLNDFGVIKPELLKGPVEVWYMTEAGWREVSSGITVHPEKISLGITHELLGEIKERNLQKAWVALQGDFWSPHGEARGLIQSKGLRHTSMSVGDVFKIGHRAWVVAASGFDEIDLTKSRVSAMEARVAASYIRKQG
jgi:hypothetical protein